MRTTTVLLSLLLSSVAAADNVVDLSADFETASLVSPGAAAIEATAAAFPKIRISLILEDGKIVSEYARDDVDPSDPYHVFSTTKSWISLLFAIMIREGLVELDETLGDVFTNASDWSEVNATEVDFVQNVTIYEMLTMSSGLQDPPPGSLPDLDPLTVFLDGGVAGGGSLAGSLAWPSLGEKGAFSYLAVSNIMSYVIQERTNMSPREYASEKVLPALGILDSDIGWWQNADGVEYSYHGMLPTAKQMAKFGQLYLQGKRSAPDTPLISSEWASNSTSVQVESAPVVSPTNPAVSLTGKYGYLFWIFDGAAVGFPDAGEFYCAIGLGGQDICVHPELKRVSIQQRDFEDGAGNFALHAVAFNKTLSFEEVEDGNTTTTTTSGSTWLRSSTFIIGLSLAAFTTIAM